jgi:EAL domain-containing protein (putative c-di-GMP-specific phosphodiesterase class I)
MQQKKQELEELKKIINNKLVRTFFQPIINLKTCDLLGYEALSRGPKDSQLKDPLKLFDLARKNNLLFALEKVTRENALLKAKDLSADYNIFINIDPQVVYDQNFKSGVTKDILEQLSISQENIVIELTEKTCIDDFETFELALNNYQKQGYKIAIDDTGAGYSGLQSLVSISYNYIKLDHSLIKEINQDKVKQELLKSLLRFSKFIDCKIIAEGIETKEEFKTLTKLGITYGQGYFIARPKNDIKHIMKKKSV